MFFSVKFSNCVTVRVEPQSSSVVQNQRSHKLSGRYVLREINNHRNLIQANESSSTNNTVEMMTQVPEIRKKEE